LVGVILSSPLPEGDGIHNVTSPSGKRERVRAENGKVYM
jgi:hypothetical protein